MSKFDFTTTLTGIDGEEIKVGGPTGPETWPVGKICAGALMHPSDKPTTGADLARRLNLAEKLFASEAGVTLTDADADFVRDAVVEAYGQQMPIVAARIGQFFAGKLPKKTLAVPDA